MKNISFTSEINTHQSALQNFAINFTNDFDDAKDLVQDTFVKALKYADLYEDGTNLRGWLYTIMKNTFINDYRKSSMKKKVIYTTEEIQPYHLMKSSTMNLGVGALIGEDIHKALEKLDPAYQVPFLKFFEGYKYHEIADDLSIPIGTVKTRIHEARKILKTNLKMYKAD